MRIVDQLSLEPRVQKYLRHCVKMQAVRKRFDSPGMPELFWELDLTREELHTEILEVFRAQRRDRVDLAFQTLVYNFLTEEAGNG